MKEKAASPSLIDERVPGTQAHSLWQSSHPWTRVRRKARQAGVEGALVLRRWQRRL